MIPFIYNLSSRAALWRTDRGDAGIVTPPPFILALTRPVSAYGNSLTAGNISGVGVSYPTLLSGYVSTFPVANEGHGGDTSTQVADRVDDTDPTLYNTVGLNRGQLNAGTVIMSMERNTIDSTAGTVITPGILTQIARAKNAIAAVPNDNWFIASEANADVEPAGVAGWAQIRWIHRELCRLYPTRVIDWRFLLAQYPDGSAQDADNVANDVPPASCRLLADGTINSLHYGEKGNKIFAWKGVWPAVAGVEGFCWVPPYEEHYVSATSAQTINGAVLDCPYRGTVDSFVLLTNGTDFQIHPTTGAITRKTGTILTAPYYDLQVQAARGDYTCTGLLRIFIGENGTACSDTHFYNHALQQPDSPTSVDSDQGALYICFQTDEGTDGKAMALIGSESINGPRLDRTVNNTLEFQCHTSGGSLCVHLLSQASGAGLITHASGFVWVLIRWNLSGTPSASMLVNGVDVLSPVSQTLTAAATCLYSNRYMLMVQNFSRVNPAQLLFRAHGFFNVDIDWTNSAIRDEIYDSGTLAAVALPSDGKVNGKTPLFWLPGNDADRMWGRNRGTGGPWVTAIAADAPPSLPITPPDGTFVPTDLGSKLLAWWRPGAHGGSNMTDDGGGLISSWKDDVGTLDRTAATTARPTWSATAVNATDSGLTFDGTTDCLTGTTMGNLPVAANPGWIVGIASNAGLGDGQSRMVYARGGTGSGTQRRIIKNTVDTMTAGDGTTTTSGNNLLTNWAAAAIFAAHFEATQYTLRANGRQGAATTGATLNTSTTRGRIGASTATAAANFWSGAIGDIFELSGDASLVDVQKLEGWLAWHYNTVSTLAVDHPYKRSRP